MLRRIYEDDNLASLLAHIDESVDFRGICIRISGTTDTAQTLKLDEIGRIQYIKRGVTIIDADFDYLHALNHIIGGNPLDNAAEAGATEFFVYIPRSFKDTNIEHVVPADNAQIRCTFNAALATKLVTSPLVQVFLDVEKGSQKYDLVIRQWAHSISGAATVPIVYEQPNIMLVALSDRESGDLTLAASNITQLTFAIGGEVSDYDLGSLEAVTNALMRIEADFVLAALPYIAQGDITSRLSDNIRFGVTTSGAAITEVLILSALFDFGRFQHTARAQMERVRTVVSHKTAKNQKDTVLTLKRTGIRSTAM